MSVADAAKESRVRALEATRDALADAIDAGGGTIAQNVAQFRAVLAELDELVPPKRQTEETGLSDFEKRLRERESRAKGPRRAKSG